MYVRKTRDEYRIMGDYGYGFEELYVTDSRKEALDDLWAYRKNEPFAYFKIERKRVKIQQEEGSV